MEIVSSDRASLGKNWATADNAAVTPFSDGEVRIVLTWKSGGKIVLMFANEGEALKKLANLGFSRGRGKNPVPPSSRQGQTRPARSHIDAAANLYERFTGNEPHKNARLVDEPERNAFLRVGTVAGILYNTNRDGRMEKYIHHFHPKSAPELLVSHDGKVARTLGGRFTFTDRGFVDQDADGIEIE